MTRDPSHVSPDAVAVMLVYAFLIGAVVGAVVGAIWALR